MKLLVVYDSFFGNTEKIAQAIGEALRPKGEVSVLRVGDVRPEDLTGLDWLIVGSPTRAFSPSPAIKTFLADIPRNGLKSVKTAAFDTRADVKEVNSAVLTFFVSIFGYAAQPIAKKLIQKGGGPAGEPEGFFITASEGPLREGELERAADWARKIAG